MLHQRSDMMKTIFISDLTSGLHHMQCLWDCMCRCEGSLWLTSVISGVCVHVRVRACACACVHATALPVAPSVSLHGESLPGLVLPHPIACTRTHAHIHHSAARRDTEASDPGSGGRIFMLIV